MDTDPTSPNYGQFVAAGTPYQSGEGCVYPVQRADALQPAERGWRHLEGLRAGPRQPDGTGSAIHDAGGCGGPSTNPTADPVPNPGSANATDQYVPKHFPFAWFHSLIDDPINCDPTHIANLFSKASGLYHDLQSVATTPEFSWITPNNCSDAHDAVCHGNNLSGGWADPYTPNAPINYTGGLYAADLSWSTSSPRSRPPGVQAERPDRRHVRRGVPRVHVHVQQLQQLDDRPGDRRIVARGRLGRREHQRRERRLRADGTEHPAPHQRRGRPALPGSR